MSNVDRREYLKYIGAFTGISAVSGTAAAQKRDNSRKPTTTDKGPIGWETYRQLDRLPTLHDDDGVNTWEISSFDRSGGNNDGFNGADSCLRETDDSRCVIAEETGAGEVASIWFTRNGGNVTANGTITIELDGETVLEALLQDVVNGKLGAPFEFPLVANADQSSGGVYIKVPMPFQEHMRIVIDSAHFYRIIYRTFADTKGVETFAPSEPADDVLEMLRNAGTQDPTAPNKNASTASKSFSLDPSETVTLDQEHGPGMVSAFRLRIPQLVGPNDESITDDGRAFGENGSSEFTVDISPDNDGVRLIRRLDTGIGDQRARIFVDGEAVAEWSGLPETVSGQWRNQTVKLPTSATTNKSEITIRNEFISSELDFNEFIYRVQSRVNGEWDQTDMVDVGSDSIESENAHDYQITNQTWEGMQTYTYSVEYGEDILASSDILENARVRMRFDGNQTVDAPLGEFFGSGRAEKKVRALFFAMDTSEEGWYSSWWPMPYQHSATIELYNGSNHTITKGEVKVTASRSSKFAKALSPNGDMGYFHATSNNGETTPDEDWIFLETAGRGKFVGVTHTMSGDQAGSTFLEGDERVYVDNSRYPHLHGTGTEDYYEGGWYFNRGTFTNPMNGNPLRETNNALSEHDTRGCYRVMVPDEISFSSSLRFGIQHGPADNIPGKYGSTAYWYGKERPTLRQTDTLDVGDAGSENMHNYSSGSPGTAKDLTSTFVGDFQMVKVTEDGRATSAPIEFTLSIDQQNSGVMLRRMADHADDYQAARILVAESKGKTKNNGENTDKNSRSGEYQEVGVWQQPRGNKTHRWIEDTFELPAAITAKAKALRIRLEPLSDAPAWHAAQYEAFVHTKPSKDNKAPSQVTGLNATSESNTIKLSWEAASDDVGVETYEIYASKQSDPEIGDNTLLGKTVITGFTHKDLELNETWYYRVRAVDGAGNTGPASELASATTEAILRLEGESIVPSPDARTDPAVSQGMSNFGSGWSGDAQVWFQGDAVDDYAKLSFEVPNSGTYELSAVFTKARDYGIHELSVDGEATGQTFDGYNPTVVPSDRINYGEFNFDASEHTVTLTIKGQNSNSSGYYAGIDFIELKLI